MNFLFSRLKLALVSMAMTLAYLTPAQAQDTYVVYTSADKGLLKEIKSQAPQHVKTRTYNVGLLSLADYFARQKIHARLMRADYLIFLSDEAKSSFSGSLIERETSLVIDSIDAYNNFTETLLPSKGL